MFASKSIVSAPIKPIVPITIKVSSNGKTEVNIADGASIATFDSLGDLTTEQAKASLSALKSAYTEIKTNAEKPGGYKSLLRIHEKLIGLKDLCKDFTPATQDQTTGGFFSKKKTVNAASINSDLLQKIKSVANDILLESSKSSTGDVEISIKDAVNNAANAVIITVASGDAVAVKDNLNDLGTNSSIDEKNNELAKAIETVESALQAAAVAVARPMPNSIEVGQLNDLSHNADVGANSTAALTHVNLESNPGVDDTLSGAGLGGGKRRRKTHKRKRAQYRKGRRTMNRRWHYTDQREK